MKRTMLCSVLVMISFITTNVYAYDIAVENADGATIYYNYINNGEELEVTNGVSAISNNNRTDYSGSIVIPEEVTYMNRTRKVTRIGAWTFDNCKGLTSVTIPSSVTSIGNGAFRSCISLTSITIPSSVTGIGEALFYYCTNLTSVSIPNSLTNISNNAFSHCFSLTSVTIPESVTSIGAYAFADCTSLTSITIPTGVTSIPSALFMGCSGLISVNIPNSVTSIGQYAFVRCTSLESIIIPNSVTKIGVDAFEYCSSLNSITIPNSVTVIGDNAFDGCNLEAVTSMIEEPFTIRGKDSMYRAFSAETFNNAVLFVPADAIEKYKATEGWQDFANIITLNSIKHPFVEAGKRWCVHGFNVGSTHIVIDYYFAKDEEETIDGKTYLPMYEKREGQIILVGLFREENHRVYLYNKDAGREFLTYDFSLQEGDSFEPEYGDFSHGKVTKVTYKDVNGEKLKVITFEANDGHYLGGNDRVEMEWIEGIGYPSRPLGGLFSKNMDPSWYYYTAYVLYDNTREPNYYLPFSFHLPYDGWWGQQSQSTRIATGAEPGLHYELLPDPARDGYQLHVYGDTFWSNSPNRYVYLIDDKSDGFTHKLKFQFEELEPCVDGVGWYHIDMYFPFFLPENKYVVVDEQGEHPVPVLGDYRPFIEEGKEWEVAHLAAGIDWADKALVKDCFYFDGDIMVNGWLCKKMMCRTEYSIYAWGKSTTTTYVGALYEENRRVYCALPDSSDFVLLYDFGSSVGTEITYYSTEGKGMYKGYIKNRKISEDEKYHGRMTIIPYYDREHDIFLNDDAYDYIWREGVGYKGFTNSFDLNQSPYTKLMSCTVGDEVLYYDSSMVFYAQATPDPSEVKKNTIDFTHVVKTQPKAPKRNGSGSEETLPSFSGEGSGERLTGEYSLKELFVNFKSLAGPYLITICDDSGTEVYRKEVQTSSVVGLNTDVSGYAKGNYTITVENDAEAYVAEFSIDEEVGIGRPTPDPSRDGGEQAGAVYDLSGRKVIGLSLPSLTGEGSGVRPTLPRGVYIKDGRKVVVK